MAVNTLYGHIVPVHLRNYCMLPEPFHCQHVLIAPGIHIHHLPRPSTPKARAFGEGIPYPRPQRQRHRTGTLTMLARS